MDTRKKKQLADAGWQLGDAADFLELTPEEREFIDLKLALAQGVRQTREQVGLTQSQLANRLGSSQSRVAKMEAGDSSVSVDLMVRSLLKLGARRPDVARLMRGRKKRPRNPKETA